MRSSLRALLAALLFGVFLLGTGEPATAAPIGGLLIFPGASLDAASMHVHTSAACPAKADAFYAIAKGHGFPAAGQIVISNTTAGLSHTHAFDGYLAETLADFAKDNQATLQGDYEITLYCVDSFTLISYGEFTGSLRFGADHAYAAVGPAMPTATPSPQPPDDDPVPFADQGQGPALVAPTTVGPSTAVAHAGTLGGEPTSWTLVVVLTLVVLAMGAALLYRPRRLAAIDAVAAVQPSAAPAGTPKKAAGAKTTTAPVPRPAKRRASTGDQRP